MLQVVLCCNEPPGNNVENLNATTAVGNNSYVWQIINNSPVVFASLNQSGLYRFSTVVTALTDNNYLTLYNNAAMLMILGLVLLVVLPISVMVRSTSPCSSCAIMA